MKKYVDIKKYWRKIRPYAISAEATEIWKRDLKKYHTAFRMYGHKLDKKTFDADWFDRIPKFELRILNGKPSDYDSCEWRYGKPGRGRKPAFWDYVVHGKCHWMANLNLFLAEKVFPKKPWRIITSNKHSCVWNGDDLLFDMNYSALVPDVTQHPFFGELDDDVTVLEAGEELEIGTTEEDVAVLDKYDEGSISFDEMYDHFF